MNEQEKQWREEFIAWRNARQPALNNMDNAFAAFFDAKQSSQSIIDQQAKDIEELKARNAMLVYSFTPLIEILRQWEPDHSSGSDRQQIVRAKEAINATPAQLSEWMEQKHVEWIGEPVGEMACDARTGHAFNVLWYKAALPIGSKIYAIPQSDKE